MRLDNWGKPGSIYHVSGRAVDIGREVQYSNMGTKLQNKFIYWSGGIVSITLRSVASLKVW